MHGTQVSYKAGLMPSLKLKDMFSFALTELACSSHTFRHTQRQVTL